MNSNFDSFNRRPRSHSGSGFGPNSGFPPHTEMAFRPGRDNFNEFSEVGGPPNHPPPNSGFGRSFSNSMNMPNAPPPSSLSQSFPSGPGSFPPPAGMGSSYAMGTREHDSFSGFDSSPGMNPTGFPPHSGSAYPNSYDGSPLSDNHFPPPMDDGGFSRGRSLSAGGGGFGLGQPPAILPPPGSMTPYSSHYGKRARRSSSVGPGMGMGMGMGFGGGYAPEYHRPGGRVTVKFRVKGESHSGVSVNEALHRERLSQNHGYMMHDIAPDMLGRITLKVRWSGYHSNTYEIPLSADVNGYVNLTSIARRTARAIVHFMQANGIILSWDRVVIHRLEETRPGIWIPVLTTH